MPISRVKRIARSEASNALLTIPITYPGERERRIGTANSGPTSSLLAWGSVHGLIQVSVL